MKISNALKAGTRFLAVSALSLGMSGAAWAVTSGEMFAYAEATYPSLFAGGPVSGNYQQFEYRYYPTSQNYLAVDSSNMVYVQGPVSQNQLMSVGPLSAFDGLVVAWQATQTSAVPKLDLSKCGSQIDAGSGMRMGLSCGAGVMSDFSNLTLVDTLTDKGTCTATYSKGILTVSKGGQSASVEMNGEQMDSVTAWVNGSALTPMLLAPLAKAATGTTADVAKVRWKVDGRVDFIQGGSVAVGGKYTLFTCTTL
jgi:hypothetical protein